MKNGIFKIVRGWGLSLFIFKIYEYVKKIGFLNKIEVLLEKKEWWKVIGKVVGRVCYGY